ncbi:MAG TPA: hypothetical protein VI197_30725, partial [Polyangiaceae bacterium]
WRSSRARTSWRSSAAAPDSGEPYLVLEHLMGETLAARLDRLGPFSLESACDYVLQAITPAPAVDAVETNSLPEFGGRW